jgi:protein-disulfide isomerase
MTPILFASLLLTAQFTTDQKKEVQEIVKEYLLENPEVLIEAGQAYQKKQHGKLQSKVQDNLSKYRDDLLHRKGPILGNEKGAITIVEFLDYQCPHCKEMDPIIKKLIESNHELRIVVVPLPFMGPASAYASKAALAAEKEGVFPKFHDALMQNSGTLTNDKILEIAKSVGLDSSKLQNEMEAFNTPINDNKQFAKSIGIIGTPAFIIIPTEATSSSKVQFLAGVVKQPVLEEAVKEVSTQ